MAVVTSRARELLHTAAEEAAQCADPYLFIRVMLRLAEIAHAQGDRVVASNSLSQAEERLAGTEYRFLQQQAKEIRSMLAIP